MGRTNAAKHAMAVVACALATAACESSPPSESNQTAAMQASEAGDQKTAIDLAKKEVARFSAPNQCSSSTNYNCGTLALSYGSLAAYQILGGDWADGARSFASAKAALSRTPPDNKASATAMVYRDVSEAFWKTGDRAWAVAVFKEGRAAGADKWLFMCSAAAVADGR